MPELLTPISTTTPAHLTPRPYQREAVQGCLMAHAQGQRRQPTNATDTVLRMALACWCADPGHGMPPAQHTRIRARLTDQRPLTAEERAQVREPLLAWCRRRGGERLAAVVRRQYDAATAVLQEVAP